MSSKSQAETKTLKVGDVAPDFTLKTATNQDWRLADFHGKKNVVLAFVPYAFSKVCSVQLPSYEAELSHFKDLDTEVASITMDSRYALSAWAVSLPTSFPLLSDFYPQGQVVDLYGLRHTRGMPNRAVVVIDKEGIIRYIEVLDEAGDLPDNADLFEALHKLQ